MSFVDDPDDLEAWRAAVRPNTKAFYGESIGNPKADSLDIAGISAAAHDVGVPLIGARRPVPAGHQSGR